MSSSYSPTLGALVRIPGFWSMFFSLVRAGGYLECSLQYFSQQVKARADKTGSSSLVYLANTLREVIKVAHHLIANSPRTDGGEGNRPGVVVEYTPEGERVLRVRLTVPEDGAIAP